MQNTALAIIMLLGSLFGVESEAHMHIEKKDYSQLWEQAFVLENKYVPDVPYRDIFERAADRYDLPVMLLMAVARGESGFSSTARSQKNCVGVMQLCWSTAKAMGMTSKSQRYDPEMNIFTGARYLRHLLDLHGGNYYRAICAYNYGEARIHAKLPNHRIPNGAQWYAGYIWYHYARLRNGSGYDPAIKGRIHVKEFDDPDRANAIIAVLNTIRGLRLDCARMKNGRTAVVLLYSSNAERDSAMRKLITYGMARGRG